MSLVLQQNITQEFATKTEIHYMLRVPYAALARAINGGKLAVHLIDGKIQIEVSEAIKVFARPQTDLFS